MVLYKYLQHYYAEGLVSHGEVLFRSLLHFLSCEDARRDELEGTHSYAPPSGLPVNNMTQGWSRAMPGWSMDAGVKSPDKVFVYCTSLVLSAKLAAKFACDACVEIGDIEKFVLRLKTALRRLPRVKLATLRHGEVEYYRTAEPPGAVYALPDAIIMNKPLEFGDEQEYRFCFSLKPDTFDFENADLRLRKGAVARVAPGPYPQLMVRLGIMRDCCRICGF